VQSGTISEKCVHFVFSFEGIQLWLKLSTQSLFIFGFILFILQLPSKHIAFACAHDVPAPT
jgi:hypothetical protein